MHFYELLQVPLARRAIRLRPWYRRISSFLVRVSCACPQTPPCVPLRAARRPPALLTLRVNGHIVRASSARLQTPPRPACPVPPSGCARISGHFVPGICGGECKLCGVHAPGVSLACSQRVYDSSVWNTGQRSPLSHDTQSRETTARRAHASRRADAEEGCEAVGALIDLRQALASNSASHAPHIKCAFSDKVPYPYHLPFAYIAALDRTEEQFH